MQNHDQATADGGSDRPVGDAELQAVLAAWHSATIACSRRTRRCAARCTGLTDELEVKKPGSWRRKEPAGRPRANGVPRGA